jgi:hypothetical protein
MKIELKILFILHTALNTIKFYLCHLKNSAIVKLTADEVACF